MFYSHQLLARKAPLGQIWMAATMHPKINRRNLDKLNIIKICEEILNPSVPMALRLSGILMGGVVIVYERKVKLLYDDVTRLLAEINQAWTVKVFPDPTVLPKGKSQAKYEAVTMRDNQDAELGEIEQSVQCSESATMMGFQQTTYIAMRLDNVDEPLISHNNPSGEDLSQNYHQADAANITISDHFDTYQTDRDIFNRFERFDIEGDEGTQLNFTPPEQTEIPSTLIPSPVIQEEPPKPDEIHEQHPEDPGNQQSDEGKENNQPQKDRQRQGPPRRRARRPAVSVMDYEQNIIPAHMYQSWLQDASDVVSRRGRKRKRMGTVSSMKIPHLMELPSVVLIGGLFANGTGEIHYPAPLLKLSMRSAQPPQNSPNGRASPPQPSSSSPPERTHYQDPVPFEEINSGVGSHSLEVSVEKQRTMFTTNNMATEILTEELRTSFMNTGFTVPEANVIVTPGNSGNEVRSIPGSGSEHGFVSNNSEVNSGRSKKRQYSSSHGGSSLEPVAEENLWEKPDMDFKLCRLSENGPPPENDLLVETGPTQTQNYPIINQPIDQLTDSIRMQLKMHFDTPESPQVLSLNQLAVGMNRKRAACLFYQTCVLATREFARVEQMVPYGDILISRGARM